MRIWYPISVTELDNKRLLAEHNEIYIIARVIAGISKGWRNHPEVLRWKGHSKALKVRHDELANEMIHRGMNHKSPWPDILIDIQDTEDFPSSTWEPIEIMKQKLNEKKLKQNRYDFLKAVR